MNQSVEGLLSNRAIPYFFFFISLFGQKKKKKCFNSFLGFSLVGFNSPNQSKVVSFHSLQHNYLTSFNISVVNKKVLFNFYLTCHIKTWFAVIPKKKAFKSCVTCVCCLSAYEGSQCPPSPGRSFPPNHRVSCQPG